MPEYEAPGQCPVCNHRLRIARMRCPHCGTVIEGDYEPGKFGRLTREQRGFAELFIASRGNLRELERMLGISYPTVRSRLEAVIQALGYPPDRRGTEAGSEEGQELVHPTPAGGGERQERKQILSALERGEISVREALARLTGQGEAGRAQANPPASGARQDEVTVHAVEPEPTLAPSSGTTPQPGAGLTPTSASGPPEVPAP